MIALLFCYHVVIILVPNRLQTAQANTPTFIDAVDPAAHGFPLILYFAPSSKSGHQFV